MLARVGAFDILRLVHPVAALAPDRLGSKLDALAVQVVVSATGTVQLAFLIKLLIMDDVILTLNSLRIKFLN